MIKQLAEGEPWTLGLLPGSGVNASTVRSVLEALLPYGLQEIHLSGGVWEDGGMKHRPEGMGMGIGGRGDWGVWKTDEQKIREVRLIVDAISREFST